MRHDELLKQIHQVMKDNGVDSVTVIANDEVLRCLHGDNITKVLLPDSDNVFILPGATDVEIVYENEDPVEVWAEFGDVPMNPETE